MNPLDDIVPSERVLCLTHEQGRHERITRQLNWEGLVWEDSGVMGANYAACIHIAAAQISHHPRVC